MATTTELPVVNGSKVNVQKLSVHSLWLVLVIKVHAPKETAIHLFAEREKLENIRQSQRFWSRFLTRTHTLGWRLNESSLGVCPFAAASCSAAGGGRRNFRLKDFHHFHRFSDFYRVRAGKSAKRAARIVHLATRFHTFLIPCETEKKK